MRSELRVRKIIAQVFYKQFWLNNGQRGRKSYLKHCDHLGISSVYAPSPQPIYEKFHYLKPVEKSINNEFEGGQRRYIIILLDKEIFFQYHILFSTSLKFHFVFIYYAVVAILTLKYDTIFVASPTTQVVDEREGWHKVNKHSDQK